MWGRRLLGALEMLACALTVAVYSMPILFSSIRKSKELLRTERTLMFTDASKGSYQEEFW